jgi:hypothetical protein
MINEKLRKSANPRLTESIKAVQTSLNNIKQFYNESMQNQLELEANARQFTFALGRALAGTLLIEQAVFNIANNVEGTEEDIIVANRWCLARESTQPLIPTNADLISEEARIVFGSNAKI